MGCYSVVQEMGGRGNNGLSAINSLQVNGPEPVAKRIIANFSLQLAQNPCPLAFAQVRYAVGIVPLN